MASNPRSGSSNMNVWVFWVFFSTSGLYCWSETGWNVGCLARVAGPSGPGISQHTTEQAKLCFKPRTFSFSISPFPPFSLYYSPLCSSSSLSLSFCVGVSLIITLPFGAPSIVIVWALTIPILSTVSFCYWVRNIAHWVLPPALFSPCVIS